MDGFIFWIFCSLFSLSHKNNFPQLHPQCERSRIVAHRGLRAVHLENTHSALTHAFKLGVDGVEFDVQISRDFVPMVFHDRNLSRLTNDSRNIDDVDYHELKELWQSSENYQKKYRIATLDEILADMPPGKLINIELKETTAMYGVEAMNKVVAVIAPYKTRLNIVISSFHSDILRMVHEVDPQYKLGFLLDDKNILLSVLSVAGFLKNIDFIHPHIKLISSSPSKKLFESGVGLILWGHKKIGDESSVSSGTYCAIISDVAEQLVAKIDKRKL